MEDAEIQELCEQGQRELMGTDYLKAVNTLVTAEEAAWELKAFDTLSRLYLPLQEARRQVRQRCGEGAVRLHECCGSSQQQIDPQQILTDVPHGQLLIAGWASLEPAIQLRGLAHEQQRYVEVFLGAAFQTTEGNRVVIVAPLEESPLPSADPRSIDELRTLIPTHSLMIPFDELPHDFARGIAESSAIVMALWEWLHRPFLLAADDEGDPIRKMEAYRLTLRVDPACELAHQYLADTARTLARR